MKSEDTIAAIASGDTDSSSISIIRISGSMALNVMKHIFTTKLIDPDHRVFYGKIKSKNGDILDEVLVCVMLAPRSYTKEDIVEINCHGGVQSSKVILSEILNLGVRLAEPGEFTQRAFLNGRIDLSMAESVTDIINAKTQTALKIAQSQLQGSLYSRIVELREKLMSAIAGLEASIDYPEYEFENVSLNDVQSIIEPVIVSINRLISSFETGELIKKGVNTVIAGRPNAGKSSLLNYFLNYDRAIVTDIAGTTRDSISEPITLAGVLLNLTDTAGIRDSEDTIENMGMAISKRLAKSADFLIYLLDGSVAIADEEISIIKYLVSNNYVILLNKADLGLHYSCELLRQHFDNRLILPVSIKNDEGFFSFYEVLKSFYSSSVREDDVIITNMRHKEALVRARSSLKSAGIAIQNGLFEDFVTIDLKDAYKNLGQVIGLGLSDDVVSAVFSKFCLGK